MQEKKRLQLCRHKHKKCLMNLKYKIKAECSFAFGFYLKRRVRTMKKYQLFIDGKWVSSTGDKWIEVENPATKEIVGAVPRGNEADVDKAVAAAKAASESWAAKTPHERAEYLRRLADVIEKRKDDLCLTISNELGIPLKYAFDYHVGGAVREARYFADMAENYEYEQKTDCGMIRREPFGVVAGITPWNYPLDQATFKLFAAMAAGNTVVLKPSQNAPLCCCILAEAVEEAGFPAGVFNLVTGAGGEVGNAIALHKDIDALSFTGSTAGGIEVGRLALSTVKKITLELGGKSPLVVLKGADYAAAVADACSSAFMNTGQTCCAYTRMLIPESEKDEIEKLLTAEAAKYITGDPLDENTEVGPLISEKAFNKVKGYIEKGIAEGARLIAGEVPQSCENGYYVKPTIFMDVTNDMTIAREEIFGPVLSVITYKTGEEALAVANDTPYGLYGAVYGPADEALSFAKKIKAGGVHVNGAGGGLHMPFGGYKQSGIGREGGTFGFEDFLEIKSLCY